MATVLALSFAAFACAVPEYKSVVTYPLRNSLGHVIGHKEILQDVRGGGELDHITLYAPRLGDKGDVVGYEESVPGGAVLRDLDGRRVGVRQIDLRSRGTNQQSPGVTTIFVTP